MLVSNPSSRSKLGCFSKRRTTLTLGSMRLSASRRMGAWAASKARTRGSRQAICATSALGNSIFSRSTFRLSRPTLAYSGSSRALHTMATASSSRRPTSFQKSLSLALRSTLSSSSSAPTPPRRPRSAAQTCLSTTPVSSMPVSAWNALTARSVPDPNALEKRSPCPGWHPASPKRACSAFTACPSLPCPPTPRLRTTRPTVSSGLMVPFGPSMSGSSRGTPFDFVRGALLVGVLLVPLVVWRVPPALSPSISRVRVSFPPAPLPRPSSSLWTSSKRAHVRFPPSSPRPRLAPATPTTPCMGIQTPLVPPPLPRPPHNREGAPRCRAPTDPGFEGG
eukprot:scaffold285_cov330-Pavlova_lutheri.AAC.76